MSNLKIDLTPEIIRLHNLVQYLEAKPYPDMYEQTLKDAKAALLDEIRRINETLQSCVDGADTKNRRE